MLNLVAKLITSASAGYIANVSLLTTQLGMAGVAIAASPVGLITGLAGGLVLGATVITVSKIVYEQLETYFYNF